MQLGAKEEARKKCDVRLTFARQKSSLPEKLYEDWCKEGC